jgi:hypothetical protein
MTLLADRPQVSRVLQLLLAGALAAAGGAMAADEAPDPEFLEYLGLWEEADDEWLLVREEAASPSRTTDQADADPAHESEDPAEKVDE